MGTGEQGNKGYREVGCCCVDVAAAQICFGKKKKLCGLASIRESGAREKEVPEMVRARELGIFDKVQAGQISYDELLKN